MTSLERHDRTRTGTTSQPGRFRVNTESPPGQGRIRVNTASQPRQDRIRVDTREPPSYTSVMQAGDATLQENGTMTQVHGTRIQSASTSSNENIMNRQTSGYEAPPPAYISVINYKDFYSVSES